MNKNLSSLSISICTLFMIAARLSASPPQADEAFPPPANAAERTKIELELSKPPTPAQIAWRKMGSYGWISFRCNWGQGPGQLDCRQWVKAFKAGGCPLVIMNAKTCGNGFCTFNSRYTKYSLSGVRWRNGQGDIFREFADACRAEGIKCGAYCAVGDNGVRKTPGGLFQNGSPAVESVIPTPVEGRPFPPGHKEYKFVVDDANRFMLNQLYELVHEYGPISQIWFDGVNPPDKSKQDYCHDLWHGMVRDLSPDTIQLGFGINEPGLSNGGVRYAPGDWIPQERGMTWISGWWDYPTDTREKAEDHKLMPIPLAMKYYLVAGAADAINYFGLPPCKNGRLAPEAVAQLEQVGALLRRTFGSQAGSLWNDGKPNPLNRAEGAPEAVLDNNPDTVSTPDADGPCTLVFKAKDKANILLLEEDAPRGLRVREFCVEQEVDGQWKSIATGKGIGIRRLVQLPVVPQGAELRFRITSSRARPRLAELALFLYDPPADPIIHRDTQERVVFEGPADTAYHYTLDGSAPTAQSLLYAGPFDMPKGGLIRVLGVKDGRMSVVPFSYEVGMPKTKWKLLTFSHEEKGHPASAALDEDIATYWRSPVPGKTTDDFLVIDLGERVMLTGITYANNFSTMLTYNGRWMEPSVSVSDDPQQFGKPIHSMMFFSTDVDDPRQHVNHFAKPVTGRYVRLDMVNSKNKTVAASDFGMLVK